MSLSIALVRKDLLRRYLLDVRGDAQVLPLSVGFHLREIIQFHETDGIAAEQ
jgi:hypothetical protein